MRFGKFIGIIAVLIGLYLLWIVRFTVLLAFTGVALATVLNRVVRWLMKWQLKRGWAIALTFFGLIAAVSLIVVLMLPPFVDQASQWIDQMPAEVAKLSIWLQAVINRLPDELSGQLQQVDSLIQDLPRIASTLFSNVFLLLRGSLAAVVNSTIVIVVTLMLLANPMAYRKALVSLFPQFYRERLQEILDKCETSLVGWGVGILFNMFVITLLSVTGLSIIGVPLPIGNAILAGLLTFIPNVGPILSVVPPVILGVLDAPWKGLAVIVLYVLIQQTESNFLTPIVMKRQVSILPAFTLLSQLIFGVLFGFIGLFLALPIVVTGQVWIQELVVKDIMNNWRSRRRISGVKRGMAVKRPQTVVP